jgi:integrase
MATVVNRPGRGWVADFRDGNCKRHKRSFATKREAEAYLHKSAVQITTGEFVDDDAKTVREVFEHWLKLCVEGGQNRKREALRPTTRAIYEMTWRVHVEPRWGGMKLKHIRPGDVALWQQSMLDAGAGPKTVVNAMAVLAAIFKHGRLMGWTRAKPTEGVIRPSVRTKVHSFSREQVLALIKAADDSGEREAALMIRVLSVTGLRIGELIGLHWDAVDLDAGVIHVRRQFTHGAWSDLKTDNAKRTLPLPGQLVGLLRARKAAHDGKVARLPGAPDDRLVFPGEVAQPLDYRNWTRRHFDKVAKAAGVKGTPHMLRHFYATALIQAGESAPTVAKLLGHASAAFTMAVYADAWPSAVSGAGEKVHGLLFGNSGHKTVPKPAARHRRKSQVTELIGGPCAIRTRDQLVKSQLLYRLS